jgi:TetR/AcrR family transcriptional regulator, transcriptional repressor for nem operon
MANAVTKIASIIYPARFSGMARSQAEKSQTRKRILEVTARRLREKGLDGIGLADLMKEAGLTVGGFYKHFADRDELVSEALKLGFGSWRRRQEKGEELSFQELVISYLNEEHRDNAGSGCVLSSLVGEIGRAKSETREVVTDNVRKDLELIASLLPHPESEEARNKAIITLGALIGAIGLARAVSDPSLSQEILQVSASQILGKS